MSGPNNNPNTNEENVNSVQYLNKEQDRAKAEKAETLQSAQEGTRSSVNYKLINLEEEKRKIDANLKKIADEVAALEGDQKHSTIAQQVKALKDEVTRTDERRDSIYKDIKNIKNEKGQSLVTEFQQLGNAPSFQAVQLICDLWGITKMINFLKGSSNSFLVSAGLDKIPLIGPLLADKEAAVNFNSEMREADVREKNIETLEKLKEYTEGKIKEILNTAKLQSNPEENPANKFGIRVNPGADEGNQPEPIEGADHRVGVRVR